MGNQALNDANRHRKESLGQLQNRVAAHWAAIEELVAYVAKLDNAELDKLIDRVIRTAAHVSDAATVRGVYNGMALEEKQKREGE